MAAPTPNNALLWNAFVAALASGAVKSRPLTATNMASPGVPAIPPAIGTADAGYESLANQALAFCEQCDSDLPNDHAGAPNPAGSQHISVITTGLAIAPTTGTITWGQTGKEMLAKALALAIVEGRGYAFPSVLTSAEVVTVAAAIEDAYDVLAGLFIPYETLDLTIVNGLLFGSAYDGMLAGMFAGNPSLFNAASTPDTALATALGDVAAVFALAVDGGIAYDATITTASSNGLPLPANTSAADAEAQYGKTQLMFSLAMAAFYHRDATSLIAQFNEDEPATTAWATAVAAPVIIAYKALVAGVSAYTPTTVLNPILWNAAYAGFIAGELTGRPFEFTSTTDPALLALLAAAKVFATEVDATLGAADTTASPIPATQVGGQSGVGITVSSEGSSTTLNPTTGTILEAGTAKTNLLWGLCRAWYFKRWLNNSILDTTATTYATSAQAIVALYLETAFVALNTP